MDSTIEDQVYQMIDEFLQHLVTNKSGTVYDIGENNYTMESQMAYNLVCDYELVTFRKGYKDRSSLMDISYKGLAVLNNGGFKAYLQRIQDENDKEARRRDVEGEKTERELLMIQNQLKDYALYKKLSRIAIIISAAALILQLISLFIANR